MRPLGFMDDQYPLIIPAAGGGTESLLNRQFREEALAKNRNQTILVGGGIVLAIVAWWALR